MSRSEFNVSPALRHLITSDHPMTWRRIWRTLPLSMRTEAIFVLLRDPDEAPDLREYLVGSIAEHKHFRRRTVESFDDNKLANDGARLKIVSERVIRSLLVALHIHARVPLMMTILGALGIKSEQGLVESSDIPHDAIPHDALHAATSDALREHSAENIAVYLLSMQALYGTPFSGVRKVLARFLPTDEQVAPRIEQHQQVEYVHQHAPEAPDFTTLDNRLILAVVDSAAGIEGAANADELDDMLGELVQLNGRRHRTYFLLGFRDSVFERERQESLAAQNEERLRWYLAGYVCGLARRERWGAITEVFETEPALRTLGAAADGPAAVGGDVVFRALAHQGRYPEAGTFAKIEAVRRSTRLRSEMLRVAILLLRRGRASDARLMLETLTRYLAELPADDRDTGRFAAEVARRRALCLRLLGLSDEAMELLLDLRNSTDPETASISETELGLVAGGFRRLGEMIIPSDESDRSIFRQRLEKGEENYLAATTSSTFRSSHANFALGVLDLVRGDSREAADRIEAALTHFSGNPEVYSFDGSLSLAQLYLGVAHCHALEEGSDVARAASLILEGLSGGARMPVWMIGDTVEGMALYYPDDAMQVLEALAASKNTEVVNSLLGLSIAGRSGVLQSELLRRTEDERRSLTDRCSDAHRLLPWLLAVGRSSEAARVLDFMEDCASKGIETERYLSMMQSPDSYSPALDVDDADESCARVLLACGRRDESASALVKLGWRLLASGEAADLEYGSIVLGHIDAIGADAALSGAQLRTALEARWKEDEAEDVSHATPSSSVYDVRILVVGGNEAQERMDESIIRAVADELPGVSVEFLHTGWASNWITFAEEFVRRQGKVDGVVVMTMIRTQLGRRIRGDCQVPWRGTRARGMGGIVEAIRRVVPAARAHLARAHHSRSAR